MGCAIVIIILSFIESECGLDNFIIAIYCCGGVISLNIRELKNIIYSHG
jgi:hypothetical protein